MFTCKTFCTPGSIPSTFSFALPPEPNRDAVPYRHDLASAVVYVFYCVCSLRMSESPASRMAMVEQRKSLPQAVPSSICTEGKEVGSQLNVLPSRENRSRLRWVGEAVQASGMQVTLASPEDRCHVCRCVDSRWFLRSGAREPWTAWSSTPAQTCAGEGCCRRS